MLPLDQLDGQIWFDGEMVPWKEARIHVLTHSLHYGGAAFEGERIYHGKIFKLHQHSKRLIRSAELIALDIPFSVEEIDHASEAVVAANGLKEGYVRPIAWRGSEALGLSAAKTKPHVAIAAFPWPTYYGDETKTKGVRLKTSEWVRPSPDSAPSQSKCAGLYVICTLSRDTAEAAGFTDALMLDYRGQIAEASAANIFFVFDGELHTPTPDCFLNGITRLTVIDLAREIGLKVVERAIWPDEISRAKEVFLTGTAAEVTPVGRIDDHLFDIGPITRKLMERFTGLVAKLST